MSDGQIFVIVILLIIAGFGVAFGHIGACP